MGLRIVAWRMQSARSGRRSRTRRRWRGCRPTGDVFGPRGPVIGVRSDGRAHRRGPSDDRGRDRSGFFRCPALTGDVQGCFAPISCIGASRAARRPPGKKPTSRSRSTVSCTNTVSPSASAKSSQTQREIDHDTNPIGVGRPAQPCIRRARTRPCGARRARPASPRSALSHADRGESNVDDSGGRVTDSVVYRAGLATRTHIVYRARYCPRRFC
jgi:hypothetical protein